MDALDKTLLSALQRDVPIVARPWAVLGKSLGLSEDEMMRRVQSLKDSGIIRQISAIFDTRSLGYRSSLVAVKCEPQREDSVAAILNAHPGVSHNYRRTHPYNLWYTLAVAPNSRLGLEKTARILHEQSGAESSRLLPALRVFKIGVELNFDSSSRADAKGEIRYSERDRRAETPLTDRELQFIREMQRDLFIEAEPFVAMAQRLGIHWEEFQGMGEAMLTVGRMRRFGAVLNHRRVGFAANGMGVWQVPGREAEITAIGEKMAAFRAVSHCYRRPTYPDWHYNLFTMIHAHTPEECGVVMERIAQETGVHTYDVLYSTQEYKKARVAYFTEAEWIWEQQQVPTF